MISFRQKCPSNGSQSDVAAGTALAGRERSDFGRLRNGRRTDQLPGLSNPSKIQTFSLLYIQLHPQQHLPSIPLTLNPLSRCRTSQQPTQLPSRARRASWACRFVSPIPRANRSRPLDSLQPPILHRIHRGTRSISPRPMAIAMRRPEKSGSELRR